MRVLALDTTTRAGSLALVVNDDVIDERTGDASRTHAERLPGELEALVDAHGLALSDVDLFAVASGPGSFTGLRIGIATMQGLALVAGKPMAAVSALDALAQIAAGEMPEPVVGSWIDAQRAEVFSALYAVRPGLAFSTDRLELLEPAAAAPPEWMLRMWAAAHDLRRTVIVGDGAIRYADLIRAHGGRAGASAPRLAGAIGRMAVIAARRGQAGHPAAVQPVYVRRPDAELDRERHRVAHE